MRWMKTLNTSFAEPKSMGKIRKHCNYRILIPIYLPNFEARFYLVAMCPLNSPVIQFTVQERKLWWHSSRISTCCLWTLEYKITVIIIGFAIIDCTIIVCTGPAIHRPSSVQTGLYIILRIKWINCESESRFDYDSLNQASP